MEENTAPPDATLAERRTGTRETCRIGVRIYRTDGSNRMQDAICTDVSIGGVGVDVAWVLSVGEMVEVEFADHVSHRGDRQFRQSRGEADQKTGRADFYR